MASTEIHHIKEWDTFHQNGPFKSKLILSTKPDSRHRIPNVIERYNDTADEIRRLLQEAVDAGEGFRAYGSSWSLNHIAHDRDRMHYNAQMNIKMDISQQDMHDDSLYNHRNLFLFQCGNIIKEISRFVFDRGKSLKASGASNGQTIAGVMSTGVHGSAFDTGAVHDGIVGINLIIGPKPSDVVYLERHTRPALSNDFATKLNARVIRNDGLFNAALVGLGAFGFIHGVVIETEDLYLLKRYVKTIPKHQAIELAQQMNFETSAFRIPEEIDAQGIPNRPYHYKLYVNPYRPQDDYLAEVMYKKPYTPNYDNPIPSIKNSLSRELLETMIWFASKHKWSIPKIIKAMQKSLFPEVDSVITGTLGEIFWDSIHRGKAFAFTIGIDNSQTQHALNVFTNFINSKGPVPGAIAIRFIKASEATMAFTRFPMTCILELDGIQWRKSKNMIAFDDFAKLLIEEFKNAGIQFTIHWGKNTVWNYPGLTDYMYGAKKEEWKRYRTALLTQEMVKVFSNQFIHDVGLSDHITGVPNDLIASLDVHGAPIA